MIIEVLLSPPVAKVIWQTFLIISLVFIIYTIYKFLKRKSK